MNYYLTELFDLFIFALKLLALTYAIYFVLKRLVEWIHRSIAANRVLPSNPELTQLKLQAYERLSLFCQRISVPQVIYRLNSPGMSAKDLHDSCLISIQKEFEHNMTQQVYVSNKLWQIISLAKDESAHMVSEAYNQVGLDATGEELIQTIIEQIAKLPVNPADQALAALRKEVELTIRS